jgi:hypothetical protein
MGCAMTVKQDLNLTLSKERELARERPTTPQPLVGICCGREIYFFLQVT